MTKDTILERLAAGETIDEIAADMEASLNAAKAEYEATKTADEKKKTLNDIAEAILYDLYEYIETADPKLFETLDLAKDPTAKDIADLRLTLDGLLKFIPILVDTAEKLETAAPSKTDSIDAIFKSFFNAFGI